MPKKGESTTKVCHCGKPSLSGLKPGIAYCKFHYNVYMYGEQWALWIAGKAVCCVCKTSVTTQKSVYASAPYCKQCFYKVPEGHEGYVKDSTIEPRS